MNLEFRQARPDDHGPIAELVYSSGSDIYDHLHGSRARALEFIGYEFRSGRGFAGYPHLSVALLDGQVVATGSFYDHASYPARSRETLMNVVAFHRLGALRTLRRMVHAGQVMTRPTSGELYLSNFGVAADLRGRGIGTQFVEERLSRARTAGYSRFGLHVSLNNPRGQALYERLGLTVTGEVAFPDARAGIAPCRKMERPVAG
jgi:ribosomal protein S18 acetylase RimI-like enzyme